ncbi:transducin/WD40 repeat protein, putative [Medicago truncatula]|uniref:Transducin/WD40 repeat protein, putative n=1 Tax=Medicago truncatula TaxID=3880 RepID=G7J0F2_MEDTR|nr:transducin/WD40 repeat protein, putative [Medicago truncatula]
MTNITCYIITIIHYKQDFNKSTKKGNSFYEFRRNSRSVRPTILHFQVSDILFLSSL